MSTKIWTILSQSLVHLRIMYRNPILYPWSSTLDPGHQVNLRLVYQYNAKIPTYLSNTKIPKYQKYWHHTNIPIQLSNFISQGELSVESEKSILCQCKVYILNQQIHSNIIYHFAYKLSLGIPSHTCHLYHLSTSWHFSVYPWCI